MKRQKNQTPKRISKHYTGTSYANMIQYYEVWGCSPYLHKIDGWSKTWKQCIL